MIELTTIIELVTIISLSWGTIYAIRSFGLKREKFSFLTLNLAATVIKQVGDLLLVSVIVHLENKGQTRISARRYENIEVEGGDFLYDDDWDKCKYAGTLKIRGVPDQHKTELFDWYSLQQINEISELKERKESHRVDLEQINFLYEFKDPDTHYKDVDFWLEPYEIYDLQIMLWLPPGTYAMKAYFLGKLVKYREEEYWSFTKLFDLTSAESDTES